MPEGEVIKGENGRIFIYGNDGGEVPCLTSWTLEASASLNERNNRCMKSNEDNESSQWAEQTLEGRSFSIDLEFFWQENEDIIASSQLDATHIGVQIGFELYPNDDGGRNYVGNAIIESVSTTSEVTGDITCSVTLQGTGPLEMTLPE